MSQGGDWILTAEDVEPIGTDEGVVTGWSLHINGEIISSCGAGGPCNAACAQDTDADGDVDSADLAELLACWGNPHGAGPLCACLDNDGDGDIDSADLAEVLSTWGNCP